MSSVYLVLPVVLPILGGAVMPLLHLPEKQCLRRSVCSGVPKRVLSCFI